jgi:hypothetical protein
MFSRIAVSILLLSSTQLKAQSVSYLDCQDKAQGIEVSIYAENSESYLTLKTPGLEMMNKKIHSKNSDHTYSISKNLTYSFLTEIDGSDPQYGRYAKVSIYEAGMIKRARLYTTKPMGPDYVMIDLPNPPSKTFKSYTLTGCKYNWRFVILAPIKNDYITYGDQEDRSVEEIEQRIKDYIANEELQRRLQRIQEEYVLSVRNQLSFSEPVVAVFQPGNVAIGTGDSYRYVPASQAPYGGEPVVAIRTDGSQTGSGVGVEITFVRASLAYGYPSVPVYAGLNPGNYESGPSTFYTSYLGSDSSCSGPGTCRR